MDIIIAIVFIAVLAIITGLLTYFILKKETRNVIISKNIVYFFKDKCEDDLDEMIEFSKSNNTKYKI